MYFRYIFLPYSDLYILIGIAQVYAKICLENLNF